MARARYSRWDGTQDFGELSGDDVLRRLMDELVEHGDVDQALRRLMQRGFTDGRGREVAGLRDLLEEVRRRREELAQTAFARARSALANASPEARETTRQMLSELNRLMERHGAGEDVQEDFERFMERYGSALPGRPSNVEELVDTIKRQLAASRALLASLAPAQREQLAELSEALLGEDDLFRQELERLAANLGALGALGPPLDDEIFGLSLGLGHVAPVVSALDDLSHLEQLLAGAPSPGALAEVDFERARELLGDAAAYDLEALGELAGRLRENGLVEQREGRLRLTPRGLRRLGDQALSDLYSKLALYRAGRHPVARPGPGQERSGETKTYEWGDPLHLSIERTVRNALVRNGPGTPVRLSPLDFEVERTEAVTRSATVIMLDLSLSMPMRGNFVAAKKMALALHALISSRFPSDYLGMVGFSRYARAISLRELPEVSWDYDWGTNIQHGLALSRKLLSPQHGTRQVVMVTDGEPTSHWPKAAAEPVFAYPPTKETVDATLAEVARCTKEGITVNTFALDATGYLRNFVEQVARLNHGRAFFTTPASLGDYVLVDFLESKRLFRRRSKG